MNKSIMKKLFLSVSVFMVIVLSCYLGRGAFAEKPNRISSEPTQNSSTVAVADTPVPLSPKTIADNPETAAVLATEESYTPPATEPPASPAAESSALPAAESSNLQIGKLVGYYAAWAAYYNYYPNQIDARKLTHINYAFANIGSDLKITLGYPDVDASNIKLLNSLKQTNPDLKTMISVGGWNWSGKFSDAALTEETRIAFADSCVDFIKKIRI